MTYFIIGVAPNGKIYAKRYLVTSYYPLWSFTIETLGM